MTNHDGLFDLVNYLHTNQSVVDKVLLTCIVMTFMLYIAIGFMLAGRLPHVFRKVPSYCKRGIHMLRSAMGNLLKLFAVGALGTAIDLIVAFVVLIPVILILTFLTPSNAHDLRSSAYSFIAMAIIFGFLAGAYEYLSKNLFNDVSQDIATDVLQETKPEV